MILDMLIAVLYGPVYYLTMSARLTPMFIKWGLIEFDYERDQLRGRQARQAAFRALWLTLTMPYQIRKHVLRWFHLRR